MSSDLGKPYRDPVKVMTSGSLLVGILNTQEPEPFDAGDLYEWLKKVHAPPPKGTERAMLTPMGWIKWKEGVGVPMVSADGEEYHHPNDEEFKAVQEYFGPMIDAAKQ